MYACILADHSPRIHYEASTCVNSCAGMLCLRHLGPRLYTSHQCSGPCDKINAEIAWHYLMGKIFESVR